MYRVMTPFFRIYIGVFNFMYENVETNLTSVNSLDFPVPGLCTIEQNLP